MKATVLILISFFSLSSVSAQHSGTDRLFLKSIENNYENNMIIELPNGKEGGFYNTRSKLGVEKLFFGDFNAKVEYFIDHSFRTPIGLRIYRDSLDTSYLLEVKRVADKDENPDSKDIKIISKALPVSDEFTNMLYGKMVTTINTFTVKDKPIIPFDGYIATFRCVVGAEVWTFTIQSPTSGDVKTLSDLFRQIIEEVETDTFSHAKYIEQLSN